MADLYQLRPILQWPGQLTKNRKRATFRSTCAKTHSLLEHELSQVGAHGVVLQMAITELDIRNDGKIRADARPSHPGVILMFENCWNESLSFPCDTFDDWQDNLRAIALALEALRKVDRYGVTQKGEQYRGFKALPDPNASTFGSAGEAKQFVARLLGQEVLPSGRPAWEAFLREAEKKTHPDLGGSSETFKRVQDARKLIMTTTP